MHAYTYQPPELLTCSEDEEINEMLVQKYMLKHQEELLRYRYLLNAYRGKSEILDYHQKEKFKPDNRLIVNFPKFITDTFTGFFNGIPIKKKHEKDEITKKIADFDNTNDTEDEETELAKMACIFGRAYEYVYQDEEAQTHTIYASPLEMFIVYDDTIQQKPLFAVHYSVDKYSQKLSGLVITKESIIPISGQNQAIKFGKDIKPNVYDELPAIEYFVNEERLGLFEPVMSLCNAFNKALSEKANDVEYFSDSYLKFLGAKLDEKELNSIRDNRIINFYGDTDKQVEVGFLDKPDSDEQTEHLLDRLQTLIFTTAMVANITDESFGSSSSGTALAYKLEAMSNLALAFQRKFQSALNTRYKLFFSLGTNVPRGQKDEWRAIQYTFTRNLPRNLKEEAETASMLKGVVSDETALSVLSIVNNVSTEVKKMKQDDEALLIYDQDKKEE